MAQTRMAVDVVRGGHMSYFRVESAHPYHLICGMWKRATDESKA